MTPVLCLNCGKARSKHYTHLRDDASKLYCHKYSTGTWRPPLDESAIEQRTVESVCKFLLDEGVINELIADQLREGAWKETP